MADKKLTKVQKEILTMLKDTRGARIVVGFFDHQPRLYIDKTLVKPVITESFYFIRIWLKESYESRTKQTFYAFKPGAEITDAWRDQELERIQAETQRKREEDERRKEEEAQQLKQRLQLAAVALMTKQVPVVEFLSYQVRFEYGGRWYSLREEY